MKNFLLILLFLPLCLLSQTETTAPPATLFEVYNITVKQGQEDAFEAAVKAHNKQFHGDGLYNAAMFYNINGPFGGKYSWVMGPTNYTALDSRPAKGAHDEDWKKVTAHAEKFDAPSYWSLDTELSQLVNGGQGSKSMIWMYDLKDGQSKRWSELVGKVLEVYKAKRPTESFIVVWNNFSDTKAGQDVIVVFPFEKWAWMDRKSSFAMQYEEVHGVGSWHHFLNQFSETTNGRVDWIRERVK